MDCKETEKQDMVSTTVLYEMMARQDRTIKRLLIGFVVTVILMTAAWLLAWTSYDYTSEVCTVEAEDGIANYIGNDGDIYNGEDYSQETDAPQEGR